MSDLSFPVLSKELGDSLDACFGLLGLHRGIYTGVCGINSLLRDGGWSRTSNKTCRAHSVQVGYVNFQYRLCLEAACCGRIPVCSLACALTWLIRRTKGGRRLLVTALQLLYHDLVYRMSANRKSRVRDRLKEVDSVIETIRASGVKCAALVRLSLLQLVKAQASAPTYRREPSNYRQKRKCDPKTNILLSRERLQGIERACTRSVQCFLSGQS